MENSNIKKTKMILHKLMEVKDEKDPEWWQKTKLNLEGAAFHSKQETKQFLAIQRFNFSSQVIIPANIAP
jgi:hypothetical protein